MSTLLFLFYLFKVLTSRCIEEIIPGSDDVGTKWSAAQSGGCSLHFLAGDHSEDAYLGWLDINGGSWSDPIEIYGDGVNNTKLTRTSGVNTLNIGGSYFRLRDIELVGGDRIRCQNAISYAEFTNLKIHGTNGHNLNTEQETHHVLFKNIEFYDADSGSRDCMSIGENFHDNIIENIYCHGSGVKDGISFWEAGSYNNIIRNNVIIGTGNRGLSIREDNDLGVNIIKNNIILDTASHGVHIFAGAVLYNNLIYPSGSSAVLAADYTVTPKNIKLIGNTFVRSTSACISLENWNTNPTTFEIRNNLFLCGTYVTPQLAMSWDPNNIGISGNVIIENNAFWGSENSVVYPNSNKKLSSIDENVEDYAKYNFYPKSTSEFLNTVCSYQSSVPNDIDCVVRDNPACEVGAYEYDYTRTTPLFYIDPNSVASPIPFEDLCNLTTTTAPITSTPITSAPITSAPVTLAPVTSTPVTSTPVTPAPVTLAPVTSSPVTSVPVTSQPITTEPTTQSPTTQDPTPSSPVTSSPVTSVPVTSVPTSHVPTSTPIIVSSSSTTTNTPTSTLTPITSMPTITPNIVSSTTTIRTSITLQSSLTTDTTITNVLTSHPTVITASSPITKAPTSTLTQISDVITTDDGGGSGEIKSTVRGNISNDDEDDYNESSSESAADPMIYIIIGAILCLCITLVIIFVVFIIMKRRNYKVTTHSSQHISAYALPIGASSPVSTSMPSNNTNTLQQDTFSGIALEPAQPDVQFQYFRNHLSSVVVGSNLMMNDINIITDIHQQDTTTDNGFGEQDGGYTVPVVGDNDDNDGGVVQQINDDMCEYNYNTPMGPQHDYNQIEMANIDQNNIDNDVLILHDIQQTKGNDKYCNVELQLQADEFIIDDDNDNVIIINNGYVSTKKGINNINDQYEYDNDEGNDNDNDNEYEYYYDDDDVVNDMNNDGNQTNINTNTPIGANINTPNGGQLNEDDILWNEYIMNFKNEPTNSLQLQMFANNSIKYNNLSFKKAKLLFNNRKGKGLIE